MTVDAFNCIFGSRAFQNEVLNRPAMCVIQTMGSTNPYCAASHPGWVYTSTFPHYAQRVALHPGQETASWDRSFESPFFLDSH
jgi:hypothetical protein